MEYRAAVGDFLQFCAVERQLTRNTLEAYTRDLADFVAWFTASGTLEVTTEALKAYLQTMVAERKLAVATVRRRLACLRAFFRWAVERGVHSDPFVGWRLVLPRRKRLPRALTRGEVVGRTGRVARCHAR